MAIVLCLLDLLNNIAEPPADHRGLDMLEASPPQESVNYSSESNIVEWYGKSETILQELT